MSESDETSAPLPGEEAVSTPAPVGGVRSPAPPPGVNLTTAERRMYEYTCAVLREAKLEHMTLGVVLVMIAQTWVALCAARKKCFENTRYQTAASGWQSLAPWAEDELRCIKTLLELLPRAGMDLVMLAKIRKDMADLEDDPQDDLFDEMASHARRSPSGVLQH